MASLGSAGEQWRHPSLVVPAVASLVPSAAVAVPFATLVGGGALYNLEPSHRTWHEHDQLARSQGCTVAPVTNPVVMCDRLPWVSGNLPLTFGKR